MTAQLPELLHYQGQDLCMQATPLASYFSAFQQRPPFVVSAAQPGRGYQGRWEISADRLYLVGIRATLADGTPASLATLFPDASERVWAQWFSGVLHLPQGRRLAATTNRRSLYERELTLQIEQGRLVAAQVLHGATVLELGAAVQQVLQRPGARPAEEVSD